MDRKLKRSLRPRARGRDRARAWLEREEERGPPPLGTGLRHQQNLPAYDLAVVLVTARSNKRIALEPAMPEVNRALLAVEPGHLYVVAA